MRWYARPEGRSLELRAAPRLASWNKASDPDQVRLMEYLDDSEALLADSRIDGPWALRLDVGLPESRDLLDAGDLDNYAYPLARRVGDSALVSVWCTKGHRDHSLVRIAPAVQVSPPSQDVVVAATTASTSTVRYKEQVHAAVAHMTDLSPGAVRLELSFVVGPSRNWLNLWKPTIDSLDPLLGRTDPHRPWHPRDGRITELGMHVMVESSARNEISVGIHACPVERNDSRMRSVASNSMPRGAERTPDDELVSKRWGGVHANGTREFRDDDAGYLAWLAANPDGYVANVARRYSLNEARVHHASCRTISGQNPHNGPWTGPYVKICAPRLSDLQQWAVTIMGAPVTPCGTCRARLTP
ncbi:hypothetical protein KL864_32130 [Mycolicibacterium goodii]|uniref:hypothetical protein n=1 Tax=Mycolicibacterium goodii TaxID=134601 RepID=UPI001BDD9CED|nr:hypothetical protein [Mycolicibacterium goodii]MBU8820525.1 hypothetical protein [Mycolicibacterium goodii]